MTNRCDEPWESDALCLDRDELTHKQDVEHLCDSCGEDSDYLHMVNDEDRSVGYNDVLHVCGKCLDRRRR